jgi:hypothetical protein
MRSQNNTYLSLRELNSLRVFTLNLLTNQRPRQCFCRGFFVAVAATRYALAVDETVTGAAYELRPR